MDEIEWLKSRIRVWKTYSMMAWQAKRKAEKELAKEKQRNAELTKERDFARRMFEIEINGK